VKDKYQRYRFEAVAFFISDVRANKNSFVKY